MPAPDFPIQSTLPVRTTVLDGISVRSDVLFTNSKGQEKARLQKRRLKMLQKLGPALHRILGPDETVLFVVQAQSPLTILEQLTAAWWTRMLAAAALVITNKRVLFFPVKHDGRWRESVRAVHWGDLEQVKAAGLLIKSVSFKLKFGPKVTYTGVRSDDGRKISAIASTLMPAAAGEQTAKPEFLQLCPDCRTALTAGQYSCSACNLTFKNEKTMILRSIFLPGGGYFYTGHPLIGVVPAIIEGLLMLDILVLLLAGLASPQAMANVLSVLSILLLFWGFETAVTILHCRRYVREFIPAKRDPARVPTDVIANARG